MWGRGLLLSLSLWFVYKEKSLKHKQILDELLQKEKNCEAEFQSIYQKISNSQIPLSEIRSLWNEIGKIADKYQNFRPSKKIEKLFEEIIGEISTRLGDFRKNWLEKKNINPTNEELDIFEFFVDRFYDIAREEISDEEEKKQMKKELQLLQDLAPILGNEGLNQIFFVTNGRFTQAEIETYQILESTLFDKDVAKYTTIVRTKFEDFEKSEICEADRKKLREENDELLGILKNSKIIYVDNPKMKGRYLEMAKDTRAESRKRVITYLGTCQEIYKPNNLNELNQRINNYKTKTEQLENEIKAKQQAIKNQEAKLQSDIQVARVQQQNELEANRCNFDQQIQNSRYSYDQQLQNTRNQLQSSYQSQIQQSQQRFNQEQSDAEWRRQREIENIRNQTVSIGEVHCSRGHNSSSLEYYDKNGVRFQGGEPYFINYVYCSRCGRNDYDYTIPNAERITYEEWYRRINRNYSERIAEMNRQIQEQECRNREEISHLQQERRNRDAAFQSELNQQTQYQTQSINQQRTNNETSLNQQRYNQENQINANASSRETNLRNQSSQQIQGLRNEIQRAEQNRNNNQTNFDQFIEQLITPFSNLWRK